MSNKWTGASALFELAAVRFSKVPELLRKRSRRKKKDEGFCVSRRFKRNIFSCLVPMPLFVSPKPHWQKAFLDGGVYWPFGICVVSSFSFFLSLFLKRGVSFVQSDPLF